MTGLIVLLVLVLGPPLLWQLAKILWPLRLDASGTRFAGRPFRRYSVDTFTGYASTSETWADTSTYGGVYATSVGTGAGGSSITVRDTRRTITTAHTGFFLNDRAGAVREVDASNVGPSVAEGHLVSAAWLLRNRKVGNAFLVYNHTTGTIYIEKTHPGQRNAKRGLARMVIVLPERLQALFFLSIVGIPVMVVIGLGVEWKLARFRKRGVQPLEALLERRAAEMPQARAASTASPAGQPSAASLDVASQMKELAVLHQSGSLTPEEFQAAKAKLLEKS